MNVDGSGEGTGSGEVLAPLPLQLPSGAWKGFAQPPRAHSALHALHSSCTLAVCVPLRCRSSCA